MDMDIGEMFLNFPLHVNTRAFCGVNLSRFDKLGLKINEKIQRFTRIWIGFKSSPYLAVRHLAIAEKYARGDLLDPNRMS